MNFPKSILLVIGLLAVMVSNGQERSEPKKFSDKLFFGGSLGLSVGYITQIDVVPVAGIWVIPQWSVGLGGRYSYYSHKGYATGGPSKAYRTHIWGASAFTQIVPIPDFSEVLPIKLNGGIVFHAEYERLLIDRQRINPITSTTHGKTWVELYLVGFGYRQRLGEKSAFNIMLLWEVSKSKFSPYTQNPMIRINFTI